MLDSSLVPRLMLIYKHQSTFAPIPEADNNDIEVALWSNPRTIKKALSQAYVCWIEAMQEELHEFKRLEVWELVPPPDKAFVISLKWIYKVKLDELGVDTPMVEKSKLDEDKEGKAVDPSHYHGMIGTLLYLTASRPDLTNLLYACVPCYLQMRDHAGCHVTRRFSTLAVFNFWVIDCNVWSSKRQNKAAISVKEGIYCLAGCCAQVLG
ncbi:hypothetical protein Tco_0559482 [Tanacetum coccineum]